MALPTRPAQNGSSGNSTNTTPSISTSSAVPSAEAARRPSNAVSASTAGSFRRTSAAVASEPLLQPFLGPTFDPTAYLNATLPPLGIPTATQPILPAKALGLPALAAHAQTQLASLSALEDRLETALTERTDDILRSGARLAYAVEVLRGESVALREELLEGAIAKDLRAFVPDGVASIFQQQQQQQGLSSENEARNGQQMNRDSGQSALLPNTALPITAKQAPASDEPEALASLRSLHQMRTRLQTVISTFDEALSWPLPPSSLSLSKSLISVSAPAPASTSDGTRGTPSLEEQGQAAQAVLRESVLERLAHPQGLESLDHLNQAQVQAQGIVQAEARVAEIRTLVEIWRGTAEEKPRLKFVESLAKSVAERRREFEARTGAGVLEGRASLDSEGSIDSTGMGAGLHAGTGTGTSTVTASEPAKSGRGLLGGLRRLRDEIYLE